MIPMWKTVEKTKNLRKQAKMAQNRVYVPPDRTSQGILPKKGGQPCKK